MIPALLQGCHTPLKLEYVWANGKCHIRFSEGKTVAFCGDVYVYGNLYPFPRVGNPIFSGSGYKVCPRCRDLAWEYI